MNRPFSAYRGTDPYVFVSYAHKDSASVYPELTWLKGEGYPVWYDEGIEAGTDWRGEIASSIKNARVFLFFVSSTSAVSKNCRKEVNFAVEQNIPIIAIHLEATELPDGLSFTLSGLQAIFKYEVPDQEYRAKLVDGIASYYLRDSANEKNVPLPRVEPDSNFKKLRGGLILATMIVLIFALSRFDLLNFQTRELLEGGNVLTEPVSVIAVLPFEQSASINSSSGKLFAQEIIDRLSKHPDLYVIDSLSSFSSQLLGLGIAEKQQQLRTQEQLVS